MHADGVVVDPKCGLYHCCVGLSLVFTYTVGSASTIIQTPTTFIPTNVQPYRKEGETHGFSFLSVLLMFWFSCLVLFLFQLFHVILTSPAPNTFCSLPVSVHCIKAGSQYDDSTASVTEHHRKYFSLVKF